MSSVSSSSSSSISYTTTRESSEAQAPVSKKLLSEIDLLPFVEVRGLEKFFSKHISKKEEGPFEKRINQLFDSFFKSESNLKISHSEKLLDLWEDVIEGLTVLDKEHLKKLEEQFEKEAGLDLFKDIFNVNRIYQGMKIKDLEILFKSLVKKKEFSKVLRISLKVEDFANEAFHKVDDLASKQSFLNLRGLACEYQVLALVNDHHMDKALESLKKIVNRDVREKRLITIIETLNKKEDIEKIEKVIHEIYVSKGNQDRIKVGIEKDLMLGELVKAVIKPVEGESNIDRQDKNEQVVRIAKEIGTLGVLGEINKIKNLDLLKLNLDLLKLKVWIKDLF